MGREYFYSGLFRFYQRVLRAEGKLAAQLYSNKGATLSQVQTVENARQAAEHLIFRGRVAVQH